MKKKVNTVGAAATERLNTSEVKFISIPTDFHSLHDLKELIGNYDLVTRLTAALNNYNAHYLDSYLMNMDEVLQYIPESEWPLYTIHVRGSISNVCKSQDFTLQYLEKIQKTKKLEYDFERETLKELNLCIKMNYTRFKIIPHQKDIDHHNKYWLKEKGPFQPSYFYQFPIDQSLLRFFNCKYEKRDKTEKIMLIDTINKIVEVCPWAAKKKFETDTFTKQEFTLDKDKNLTLKQHYTVDDHYTIGGVWINGRANGYLSGGQSFPYTRNGYEMYKFCTRTNKFLGYEFGAEDKRKEWQAYKNAW